jgi:SAM-dependent methyltransferase
MVSLLRFTCNICNSPCSAETLDREIPSCRKCGSNVRFRWIVDALSLQLFGKSLPLKQFPRDRTIQGISLSDWGPIAKILSRRFDYWNTFLHREPRLDIMDGSSGADSRYDFIIASEVLEHVPPPVQSAFNNLSRLLKPGGFVVFSSPWVPEGDTKEHFPEFFDSQVVLSQSGYLLLNRTRDGRIQTFDKLAFHNGPGDTLEMRLFSLPGLETNCAAAGLEIALAEENLEYGIAWDVCSRGIILRKMKTQ